MRWRAVPALIVGLAVATMIALGFWQLARAREKDAVAARIAANGQLPEAAMPTFGPVPPTLLFRRSRLVCLEAGGWRVESGRAADGTPGYRHIVACRTGAEGPGALVDLGVSQEFRAQPAWRGGEVLGVISTEPDHASLLARLLGRAPVLRPMLVADTPAPGLKPSLKPGAADLPNSSWGYAVQWFVFAAIAAGIALLAARRRS